MKKTLHRFTALALVLVLLAGLCLQALAMHGPRPASPAIGRLSDAGHAVRLLTASLSPVKAARVSAALCRLYVVPEGSAKLSAYTMTPASVEFGDHSGAERTTRPI